MQRINTRPTSRLADYPIRPTVMKLTSRRTTASERRRGLRAAVIAAVSTLAWAAMLKFVLG